MSYFKKNYDNLLDLINSPEPLDIKKNKMSSLINYLDEQGYPNFQNCLNDILVSECFSGNYPIVEYLLLSPDITIHSEYSYKHNLPFARSCCSGSVELVHFMLTDSRLIEKGIELADINMDEGLALENAAQFNHLPLIKYLLNSPNKNKDVLENKKALLNACQFGYTDIASLLLENKPLEDTMREDIESGRDNILIAASHNGNVKTLDYLLKNYNFSLGINTLPIFKKAFSKGHMELLKYLIFDCDIEKTNEISVFLDQNKNEEAYIDTKKMFDKKEFNNQLDTDLIVKNTKNNNKFKTKI